MAAAGQWWHLAIPDLSATTADWRNRLIGSPRFQRWACSFPLARRLVRREGERVFDLMGAFVYSQVLLACVELGLLRRLRTGPMYPGELSKIIGLEEDRTATLCQAAASLDLLKRRVDGRFQLGRLGAAVVGVPGLEQMIRHHRMFYRDLADPVGLFRGETETELARFWPYVLGVGADVGDSSAESYSELMAASQGMVADEILRCVRLDGVSHLMDVGGGTGGFLTGVADAYPDLRLTLFDLPAVVGAASSILEKHGPSGRIELAAGNFRTEPLPRGADAISLVRVLFDHGDDTVGSLLARVADALPTGGRLIIAEPMSGDVSPCRFGDAYFALYTMAMQTGHVRAPRKIAKLLTAAGFAQVRFPTPRRPFVTSVVTARLAAKPLPAHFH